eukprot:692921-Pyramimonas_sp.AAC.1
MMLMLMLLLMMAMMMMHQGWGRWAPVGNGIIVLGASAGSMRLAVSRVPGAEDSWAGPGRSRTPRPRGLQASIHFHSRPCFRCVRSSGESSQGPAGLAIRARLARSKNWLTRPVTIETLLAGRDASRRVHSAEPPSSNGMSSKRRNATALHFPVC